MLIHCVEPLGSDHNNIQRSGLSIPTIISLSELLPIINSGQALDFLCIIHCLIYVSFSCIYLTFYYFDKTILITHFFEYIVSMKLLRQSPCPLSMFFLFLIVQYSTFRMINSWSIWKHSILWSFPWLILKWPLPPVLSNVMFLLSNADGKIVDTKLDNYCYRCH